MFRGNRLNVSSPKNLKDNFNTNVQIERQIKRQQLNSAITTKISDCRKRHIIDEEVLSKISDIEQKINSSRKTLNDLNELNELNELEEYNTYLSRCEGMYDIIPPESAFKRKKSARKRRSTKKKKSARKRRSTKKKKSVRKRRSTKKKKSCRKRRSTKN